jgi:hypothetical protein
MVVPVLTSRSEIWAEIKTQEGKTETAIMKLSRNASGCTRKDLIKIIKIRV